MVRDAPTTSTVERIAARAGVNKERLYSNYGGKAQLFDAILEEQLAGIVESVPFSADSPDDLVEFTGRTYDYQLRHPQLTRLLAWESLADAGSVPGESVRAVVYQDKIARLTSAQERGVIAADLPAPQLLLTLLSLANWPITSPQITRMVLGDDSADQTRAAVTHAARLLVTPRPELPDR
ncbi:TetR family transcriptional regulator [Catenuloplanes sp. NPDC051500]|uniref:TetR family transcriptional regulator n=1 Tax=Catenuloplanes sp. NPDC051500 TaxID=3363959 RepID=UPI0037A16CDE